jgi:hypothetical protein
MMRAKSPPVEGFTDFDHQAEVALAREDPTSRGAHAAAPQGLIRAGRPGTRPHSPIIAAT